MIGSLQLDFLQPSGPAVPETGRSLTSALQLPAVGGDRPVATGGSGGPGLRVRSSLIDRDSLLSAQSPSTQSPGTQSARAAARERSATERSGRPDSQESDSAGIGPESLGPDGLLAKDGPAAGGKSGPNDLSQEELQKVRALQARDREVRAHEQAHARAGGQHAGSPSYTFEIGPDGRRYAVGGEVSIDVSPVRGDPAATLAKMDQIKKAALAPASPSSQDRSVAAKAEAIKAKARAELAQLRTQGGNGDRPGPAGAVAGTSGGAIGSATGAEASLRYAAAASITVAPAKGLGGGPGSGPGGGAAGNAGAADASRILDLVA